MQTLTLPVPNQRAGTTQSLVSTFCPQRKRKMSKRACLFLVESSKSSLCFNWPCHLPWDMKMAVFLRRGLWCAQGGGMQSPVGMPVSRLPRGSSAQTCLPTWKVPVWQRVDQSAWPWAVKHFEQGLDPFLFAFPLRCSYAWGFWRECGWGISTQLQALCVWWGRLVFSFLSTFWGMLCPFLWPP